MHTVKFQTISDYIDYAVQRSRGFVRYEATNNEIHEFIKLSKSTIRQFTIVETEEIQRKHPQTFDFSDLDLVILNQNLSIEQFSEVIPGLLKHIIYPCYFRHTPIFIFSPYSRKEYSASISSKLLHIDRAHLSNSLKSEQIFNLIEKMSVVQEKPFDPHSVPVPSIQNQISQYLQKSRFEFRQNIRVGRIWFDFIIAHANRDVGLLLHSCDIRSRYFVEHRMESYAVDKLKIVHFNLDEAQEDMVRTIEKALDGSKVQYPVDSNLDTNQRKAATHMAGPIRVLAPAGAGKTKTLINRILHLLNAGVEQGSILALAFNKKAAIEMEKRLQAEGVMASRRLVPGEVAVMTFHAFGYKILQQLPGWIFDLKNATVQSQNTLRHAVAKHHELLFERNSNPLEPFEAMLNRVKMDLLQQDDMWISIGEEQIDFKPIFQDYIQLQAQKKFLTFDDMLYLSLRLLLDNADLRNKLQQRFEYVLVDEFQDLNRNQLMLIELLSMPQNNLFIVGDDDQMIYGWRGAQVSHILSFHDNYSESADSILSRNYRSVQRVVEHSRWLIDHNEQRVPKDITPRPDAALGTVDLLAGESLLDQAEKAIHWIRSHQAEHDLPWSDYAILYRYNSYQFIIAAILDNYNIPHTPVDESRLFQTGVGKDFIAYLKILKYPDESVNRDWQRILKRPNKYISNELTEAVIDFAGLENLLHSDIMPWQREKLADFIRDIKWAREKWDSEDISLDDAVTMLFSVFGLRKFYQKKLSGTAEPDMATDIIVLEVLENYVSNFESLDHFYMHWQSLEDPEREQKSAMGSEDGLQLSTIHSTKGNEYRHLVYFNLSDTVDQDESELEQERRVAYVGATRAIESLLVTIPESNHSRFAEELFLNPEFYGVSESKLRRLLKRLRKQRRNEEKSSENLARKKHQIQLNAFLNKESVSRNSEKIQQRTGFLKDINTRIEILENEFRYRQIFFPDTEKQNDI